MKKYLFILTACLMLTGTAQAQQKAKVAKQASTGVVIQKIPATVTGDELMKSISSAYKGKVIVIDFWATWCGPCRAAMKQIDPIKEKYLADKKEVAFVYVTGETSPLPAWQEAIKSIKGFHYRLTADQWTSICQSLKITGIPSYVIINKDGSKAYDNIETGGYPGDDVITTQIDKALNK